ncbi:hypothetical protein Rhopal_006712-T1 [Rhodotorula paludigena]|uniref:Alcohol dehydrogenase-like N-terminal domain-containing protein n=1 Tax=Rhodotorula paludigena TaxID=86838 RepID=A0AAV5GUR6_9BASI|nr:hypothetical protein Rhopal_006712-T1 [Rhodotorula paludigena]
MQKVPQQFRAAQFIQRGGELEIKETKLSQLHSDELVIKVQACCLGSTDELLKFDLLPDLQYPLIPGAAVVGVVAQTAQKGQQQFKEGDCVAAITGCGGLAEFCRANEAMCVKLPQQFHEGERLVQAPTMTWDAGRVWTAHHRCTEAEKRMDKHEREMVREINERMGFKGDGVVVVYGEGGFARLALDTLKKVKTSRKLILVATSDKWKANDYGLKDDEVLCINQHDVRNELKKRGGAHGIVCCDMPREGLEALLDGCRYHSTIVMMSPRRDEGMEVPIANILAKSMTLHGSPVMTHSDLRDVLSFAEQHRLEAPTRAFRFDENEVREAWQAVESRDEWKCSVVCFEQQQGMR